MESWREELYHNLKGKEMKGHKYLSREWKNGRWQYQYTTPQAQNSSNRNQSQNSNRMGNKTLDFLGVKSASKTITNIFNRAKSLVDNIVNKEQNARIRDLKTNTSESIKEKQRASNIRQNYTKEVIKKDLSSNNERSTLQDKKQSDAVRRVINDPNRIARERKKAAQEREAKRQGELELIRQANAVKKYQAEEPDFMKDIPEISHSQTADESMAEINEKYKTGDIAYAVNCARCSIAYELRCRGYDVEALPRYDKDEFARHFDDRVEMYEHEDGSNLNIPANWYTKALDGNMPEDPNTTFYKIEGPRSLFAQDYSETRDGWGDIQQNYTYRDKENVDKNAKNIKDNLLSKSGTNSRGEFCCQWIGGGGHSMVYEIDYTGNITIRDCQHNTTYTVEEIVGMSECVYTLRTDNLKLKKNILKVVTNN